MWGETGWDRLLSASYGGQIAWLLPAALAMIVVAARGLPSGWAHRPDACRRARLGRLAGRHGRGHLASARGSSTSTTPWPWPRRSGRWSASARSRSGLAGQHVWARLVAGGSHRRDRVVVDGPARPVHGVRDVAGPGGAGRWGGRRCRDPGRPVPAASVGAVALGAALAGLVVVLAGPAAYSVETASSTASGSLPSAGPAVAGRPVAGWRWRPGMRGQGPPPGLAGAAGDRPGQAPLGQATPGRRSGWHARHPRAGLAPECGPCGIARRGGHRRPVGPERWRRWPAQRQHPQLRR